MGSLKERENTNQGQKILKKEKEKQSMNKTPTVINLRDLCRRIQMKKITGSIFKNLGQIYIFERITFNLNFFAKACCGGLP